MNEKFKKGRLTQHRTFGPVLNTG